MASTIAADPCGRSRADRCKPAQRCVAGSGVQSSSIHGGRGRQRLGLRADGRFFSRRSVSGRRVPGNARPSPFDSVPGDPDLDLAARHRHRRDVHRLRTVRRTRQRDCGAEAPRHPGRPFDCSDRRHRRPAAARRRAHRRGRVDRARHDAGHQRSHRAARREDRHAGDRGVPRHPRHGLRAALRPVRTPAHVARAARTEAPAPGGLGAGGSRRTRDRGPGPREHQGGGARPRRIGRHRGARHLLPALLCQSGPRGRGGRARARGVPGTCTSRARPRSSGTCASTSAGPRRR